MSNPFLTFADRIRGGDPAIACFIGMTEPMLVETLLRDGFDTVIIDMQHGLHATRTAIDCIGAAAVAGKPALLRVPVGEFALASRMLDAGAVGIIAPMINTVEDARRLVSFTRFPPKGDRSWGPHRAVGLAGLSLPAYLQAANGATLALAMVETRAALAALDDILAVPGLDGVFVGPSDLSIALTDGATVDPLHREVETALQHVAARCAAHGKIASCFATSGARTAEMVKLGYHIVSIATDLTLYRIGARAELAAARAGMSGGAAPRPPEPSRTGY